MMKSNDNKKRKEKEEPWICPTCMRPFFEEENIFMKHYKDCKPIHTKTQKEQKMTKTYKIKHNLNLTRELAIARKVASFAIENRDKLSTKYISHLGLHSHISNQILRKYGRNKKALRITSVPLTISSHHLNIREGGIWVRQVKAFIPINTPIGKIKQIEFDKDYALISYEVSCSPTLKSKRRIGVDLNTTGHCAVVAIKETGKVFKLGKKAEHIHKKYSRMRKNLQKQGLYSVVKKIKSREKRIIKDLNHKISRKIVDLAVKEKGGVFLEQLQGIRNNRVKSKSFKYALNSWSFYQLGKFIEYKALLAGVPLSFIDPAYTSKSCSRCGLIGNRNDKSFKCQCGHVENADVNAAFNLAYTSPSILRLQADRDAGKRSIGTRQKATLKA